MYSEFLRKTPIIINQKTAAFLSLYNSSIEPASIAFIEYTRIK